MEDWLTHALSTRHLLRGALWNIWSIFNKPEDYLEHWKNVPVIFIVPGFMIGSNTMIGLGKKLSQYYNVAYLDVIPFTNVDIMTSAAHAAEKIKSIQNNGYSVIPLWWCMWELTALEAIAIKKIQVEKLLTVSTPFQWTREARKFEWLKHIWFHGIYQTNNKDALLHTQDAQKYIDKVITFITTRDKIIHPDEQNPRPLVTDERNLPFEHLDVLHGETASAFVEEVKRAIEKYKKSLYSLK